ncbi:hypothetical protein RXV95_14410 [Novosphingobium sp. ZN18A2]|uniref:hypothetical protein n=1 Tax=Novosphingobium sp. ZN18A2 TaxID=3079861 RepID=UPI0030D1AE06
MKSILAKTSLGAAVAAMSLATMAPAAQARDYDRHHGGDTTGAAIAGGIIGLALGAIIASSSNDHDRYRDGRYNYGNNGYAYGDYVYRDGYYWDRNGHRYNRREMERHRRDYYQRRGYDNRYQGYYGRGY